LQLRLFPLRFRRRRERFFEDAPMVPALMAAWVEGYRSLASLTAEDLGVLVTGASNGIGTVRR
jgi:hypothetical protein